MGNGATELKALFKRQIRSQDSKICRQKKLLVRYLRKHLVRNTHFHSTHIQNPKITGLGTMTMRTFGSPDNLVDGSIRA